MAEEAAEKTKKKEALLAHRIQNRKNLDNMLKPNQRHDRTMYTASYLDLPWKVLEVAASLNIKEDIGVTNRKLSGMALYNFNKEKLAEFLALNPGMKLSSGISHMFMSHEWGEIEKEARSLLVPGKPRKGQLNPFDGERP